MTWWSWWGGETAAERLLMAERTQTLAADRALLARLTEANADLARGVERERERFDALLSKFTALKLAGASAPEAAREAFTPEPDVVTQAIITKAKYSIAKRRHYADYVQGQRNAGVSDATIAAAILAGHSDDEEGLAL